MSCFLGMLYVLECQTTDTFKIFYKLKLVLAVASYINDIKKYLAPAWHVFTLKKYRMDTQFNITVGILCPDDE